MARRVRYPAACAPQFVIRHFFVIRHPPAAPQPWRRRVIRHSHPFSLLRSSLFFYWTLDVGRWTLGVEYQHFSFAPSSFSLLHFSLFALSSLPFHWTLDVER